MTTTRLTPTAQRFVRNYRDQGAEGAEKAAADLALLLDDLVPTSRFSVLAIDARSKTFRSMAAKVVRKGYGRPKSQMTDLVAARVVLAYQDQVDDLTAELAGRLDIDPKKSVDKRMQLELQQFGYRSVHLVGSARFADVVRYPSLAGVRFEVQIRSVLEHAWAEIEHKVVYKSGTAFPRPDLRRFSAVAATLEMLDGQFVVLRAEEALLRRKHYEAYLRGDDPEVQLDSARLAAFMATKLPRNPGWDPSPNQEAFVPGSEATIVEGLKAINVRTPNQLRTLVDNAAVRRSVANVASARGLAVQAISHFGYLLVAIGKTDITVLRDFFPLEADDPTLASAL